MKLKALFAGLFIAFAATFASAQNNNIIDEVAWIVGDQPIYKSEIEETYLMMKNENQSISGNPYCVIPERLAIDKLFLYQADRDTVEAQRSMVNMQVEAWINYLISSIGSRERVEEYFNRSLPDLRQQRTELVTNQMRIEQVKRGIIKDIKITPSDVRRYYEALPEDSIPFIPMQVEVQIITINPVIPRQEIEDIKSTLRGYSERVNKGDIEFSTLASLYSEDQATAVHGGELGFFGKGALDPEYAAVAFNLHDPKKVSKIVESQYGFHIIQLIEKRGDKVNTRHILLRPKVSEEDLNKSIVRLDSVAVDLRDNKFSFEEAARYISQDKDTRFSRGVMTNNENGSTTRFEMHQLPQEVAKVVDKMEPGEISNAFRMIDPKTNRDIVAVVKLTNRIPAHKANLADDFQVLKGLCEQDAQERALAKWIDKKIAETYIKIEDNWADCEFEHKGWVH